VVLRATRASACFDLLALLVTVGLEDGGRPVVVQEWVEAERLRPVRSDRNRRQLSY
jgi:hypothetical protein